jgi:hypothetical protein
MTYICGVCSLHPSSHSLTKLLEKDNVFYYYACPSKANLYFDTRGIIDHYNGVLSEIPKNKQWIWIFDGTGFNLKHFLQIDVAIELAKLITTKFSDNLKKIIIINPTLYISSIYNIITPFLNNKIISIIEINYDIISADDIVKI